MRRTALLTCALLVMSVWGPVAAGADTETPSATTARAAQPGQTELRNEPRVHRDDMMVPPGRAAQMAESPRLVVPTRARVLVMPTYWGRTKPSYPTRQLTRDVNGRVADYYERVSNAQHAVTASRTSLLKIKPARCDDVWAIATRAFKRAKGLGYRMKRFNRFAIVLPTCPGGAQGELPTGQSFLPGGMTTWYSGSYYDDLWSTVVHELGHNLGLKHANGLLCTTDSGEHRTLGGTCGSDEYADLWDAMGAENPHAFSARTLQRLGWRTPIVTTGAGSWLLSDTEAGGSGPRGIRLKISKKRSYWIAWQPRTTLPPGPLQSGGMTVRLHTGGPSTNFLDLWPNNSPGWWGWPDTDLINGSVPVGGGWTTPEGFRISFDRVESGRARITVSRAAVAVPAAPTITSAVSLPTETTLTWDPALGNGTYVTAYQAKEPDGTVHDVPQPSGTLIPATTTTVWTLEGDGLWQVRARNSQGWGPWSAPTQSLVEIDPDAPVITTIQPAEGTIVENSRISFTVSAGLAPNTQAPITDVKVSLPNGPWFPATAVTSPGPWTLDYPDVRLPEGPHEFDVQVWDSNNGWAIATRTLVVTHTTPTVAITSPRSGTTVTPADQWAPVDVVVAVGGNRDLVEYVSLLDADGTWIGGKALAPGATSVTVPVYLPPGSHTLSANITDGYDWQEILSGKVTFTVASP